jgi:uncharacterized protein (TIGR00290 family)
VRRALVSWSSGKDSAWTLHELRSAAELEVVGLLTTVGAVSDRVPMHAVRSELLRAQARAAGLPLWEVPLPEPCSNADYDAAMSRVLARARSEQIDSIAFGDLFLEDIRAYRESRLAGTGITPLFPLWKRPTGQLAREMLDAGLSAIVTSVDLAQVPARLCGRSWDDALIAELPPASDPCGENGEFHSFVWAGPMLAAPVAVSRGALTQSDGFVHLDLELRASGSEDFC